MGFSFRTAHPKGALLMEIWANIHKTFYLATELYKVLAYDKATEINLVWMVSA